MVTLRRAYMYEFLDRLLNVAIPRIKDFRGVSPKSFDKEGNFALGLREHTIFPELDIDKISKIKGMTINISVSKTTPQESHELLRLLGVPFAAKRQGEEIGKEGINRKTEKDTKV
jgi:large subunit ribosomal protein L5